MGNKQEGFDESRGEVFDINSCMAMMGKLMGEHNEDCDCGSTMSQATGQAGNPAEWLRVMSQMMDVHCGGQEGNVA